MSGRSGHTKTRKNEPSGEARKLTFGLLSLMSRMRQRGQLQLEELTPATRLRLMEHDAQRREGEQLNAKGANDEREK